jgi:hypothetical protein
MISSRRIAILTAMAALAAVNPAFAACDIVPAVQQASQQAGSTTAGLIADRVSSVVSSTGGGSFGSSGSGGGTGGTGGGTTGGGEKNINASSSCTTVVVALGEDDSVARRGAEAAAAKSGKINAVWVASSVTWLKKTDTNGNYGGTVSNAVVGYDRRLTDNLVGGMALGYEKVLINTGYVVGGGSVEGDTVSLSPYLGYSLTDWLVVDATAGYARIGYRFKTSTTEIGETMANRWFGATNLTAFERHGDTLLKASLGYLRIAEFQDSYTSNANSVNRASLANFGQMRAQVSVGQDIRTEYGLFTPTVFTRYEYDLPHTAKVDLASGYKSTNDRDGVVFGIGLDMVMDDWKFNLSGTSTQFRQNTEIFGLSAVARYSF